MEGQELAAADSNWEQRRQTSHAQAATDSLQQADDRRHCIKTPGAAAKPKQHLESMFLPRAF